MKLKLFLLFIIYNLSFCIVATATIRYVSKTGSSTPPYTSWASASDSIQKCINICQSGDTVYVANGVYKETVRLWQGITLNGSGWDSCIIDARDLIHNNQDNALVIEDNTNVEGFLILTSNSQLGTGIYINYAVAQVKHMKIRYANEAIYMFNSSPLVDDNVIEECRRGIQIEAFFRNYFPIIKDNFIYYPVTNGITKSVGTCPIICNNVIFLNNEFNRGIFLGATDSIFVYNNLIYSTNAEEGIGNPNSFVINYNNYIEGLFTYAAINLGNLNIIKNNNLANGNIGIRYNQGLPIVKYNNSWNNTVNYHNFTPDSTNRSVNPMIINKDSINFHLQKYSPLIDAGDPGILDLDGTRSDMGLYGGPYGQSYKYRDLSPSIPKNFIVTFDSLANKVKIKWLMNSESDFKHYIIYKDSASGLVPDSTNLYAIADTSYFEDFILAVKKNFFYRVTAVDSQGNESNPGEEIAVILVGVNEPFVEIISDFVLYQNYPNPFNPVTIISYRLKESGNVSLTVYDIKGEKIKELVSEFQEYGTHEVEFKINSTSNLSSGIYFYRIEVVNQQSHPVFRDMKKMLLIK